MILKGEYVCNTMSYSAQTRPQNVKDIFETKLEKKRKNLLGPPAGKRMLMFIDDLNMPALEQYGAQPPNELLRQIIDQGYTLYHFYVYKSCNNHLSFRRLLRYRKIIL